MLEYLHIAQKFCTYITPLFSCLSCYVEKQYDELKLSRLGFLANKGFIHAAATTTLN